MKLEHVALQVPDPVALADWYVANLGCAIVRQGGEPSHVRFLADCSGHMLLEVYRNPKVVVPDYRALNPLLLHIAWVSADLAADRDRLVRAGATLVEDILTGANGDQVAMLRDPWGLPLQLARRTVPMLKPG